MYSDTIADLLTRIRNAQIAGHRIVMVPASKMKESIVNALIEEGYLLKFDKVEDENKKPALKIYLKYLDIGTPVIKEIHRLSRSGRRVYVGKEEIPRFRAGLGTVLLSTPKGILCDREARREGIGGELICSVF